MPSQDHPTFYHIGQKLENHEGRLTKLEWLAEQSLLWGRRCIVVVLCAIAALLNLSPSYWAHLLQTTIEVALSR